MCSAVPAPPGEITLIDRTSSTLNLNWVPTNGYFDAYEITVSERGGSPQDIRTIQVPFTQSEYELMDLTPATDYDISIVSIAGLDEENEVHSESSDAVFRTSK